MKFNVVRYLILSDLIWLGHTICLTRAYLYCVQSV